MPDEIYAAVYDGQIEATGASPGFVIHDGIDRSRFTIGDVNAREVSVWKRVGFAEVAFVVDAAMGGEK